MQPFPHFHWIAIESKRPNIPENFIREEFRNNEAISNNEINNAANINNKEDVIMAEIDNKDNKLAAATIINNSDPKKKVVPPVIHSISKELQTFLENFEQRFRKEIKLSKLNPFPLFNLSKELQISNLKDIILFLNKRLKCNSNRARYS